MNIDLKGKRALVCGSTQGIGKAIALAFAEVGAEVILLARNQRALQEVKDLLSVAAGQHHSYLVGDFSKPEQLKEAIAQPTLHENTVHILVNNTGGPPPGPVSTASPADFLEAFNRHLICNQLLVQSVLEGMKKERYGRILNIISTSVKEPITGLGVSNTTRAAVAGWSKTLSNENAAYGITVNNILPGYTQTGRLKALLEQKASSSGCSIEQVKQDMLKEVPAGRFAEPEEPAALAVFLASPYAGYINGVNIQVDGGKTKTF